MKASLQQAPEKALYALHKQTVEPVFGIIKSGMGFIRSHLRRLANVATEWTLVVLAYNYRRITRLMAA
ncbi:transposase [Gluconobacter oxydans]|nr:transposase [Gluconobacter oxydans]